MADDPDDLAAQDARDWRRRRWGILTEDGAIFGLTRAETGELTLLEREFGPSGLPDQFRTLDRGTTP
jgi:hypothetical protein